MNPCKKSNGRAKGCRHSSLIIVYSRRKVRTYSTCAETITNEKVDRFREAESTLRRTIISLSILERSASERTDVRRSWMLERADTLLFLSRMLGDMVRELALQPDSDTDGQDAI